MPDEVERHAVFHQAALVVGERDFISCSDVDGIGETGAEAKGGADEVAIAAGIIHAEVEEVATFKVDGCWDQAADLFREVAGAVTGVHHVEPVHFDEWNEVLADFVAGVGAEPSGAGLLIGEGELDAESASELPLIDQFEAGKDQVDGSISFALEDVGIASWKLESGGSAYGGAGVWIEDEGVFEASAEIGETGFTGESLVRVEVDVAVLGRNDRQSLVESVLELKRIDFKVATDRQFRTASSGDLVGQPLIDENRVDVGGRQGQVKQRRVADRPAGLGKTVGARGGHRFAGFNGDRASEHERTEEPEGTEGDGGLCHIGDRSRTAA